ncbi:MAG: cob(I)yrinic acid a,c-diamide adenosyltransferase [Burkholderiales bacterium]|nr:cob(I)yrinic acid a,c-diamide adenosyltransferase [Burkholderiales bacterium]
MLYTRKGDNGTTKTFGCDQRISKSSAIAEALGSLDETNSFLGLCKVKASQKGQTLILQEGLSLASIIHDIQKNLFIIQAELAGASMSIDQEKLDELEKIVDTIEKQLPPIKTFFISGGTELAATFDFARTISRRAERRVIAVADEGKVEIKPSTKAYLNRLSSVLYAFARLANHEAKITEESPDYK